MVFYLFRRKGSHAKYRKLGNPTRTVIVPTGRKEMPNGTFRSIVRQSGLTEADFN
ncbi:type II toxin-antitoxin system HicA family toxin [Spirosoma gilvum]